MAGRSGDGVWSLADCAIRIVVEFAAVGRSGSSFGQGSSSFIAAYSSLAVLVPRPLRTYTPRDRKKSRSLVVAFIEAL